MLLPQEITELRRTVASHQHLTAGLKRRTRFEGGPLDGMMISLDEGVIPARFVGWAKQAKAGLVQCLYTPAADGSRQFAEYVLTSSAARS